MHSHDAVLYEVQRFDERQFMGDRSERGPQINELGHSGKKKAVSMSGKKKTALVTGCSTGIGEATAKFLAQKGWTVFAGVRKDADSQRLRSVDINIKPVILDVTKEEQIRSAMEEIRVAVGEDGLDALVNNAGLAIAGPIEFTSAADVMLQFEVNVFGVLRMIQAAMPLIRMGAPGRVVNIGSVAAEYNWPYAGIYEATKSALISITEAFRREVTKFGIKASLIQLGPVKTQVMPTMTERYKALKNEISGGSSCEQFYGKALDKFMQTLTSINNGGIEASDIAHLVHRVLTSKEPKNMYYDTWATWWGVKKISWSPVAWNDSVMDSAFGVKE